MKKVLSIRLIEKSFTLLKLITKKMDNIKLKRRRVNRRMGRKRIKRKKAAPLIISHLHQNQLVILQIIPPTKQSSH
jgi:hypothetical protein